MSDVGSEDEVAEGTAPGDKIVGPCKVRVFRNDADEA